MPRRTCRGLLAEQVFRTAAASADAGSLAELSRAATSSGCLDVGRALALQAEDEASKVIAGTSGASGLIGMAKAARAFAQLGDVEGANRATAAIRSIDTPVAQAALRIADNSSSASRDAMWVYIRAGDFAAARRVLAQRAAAARDGDIAASSGSSSLADDQWAWADIPRAYALLGDPARALDFARRASHSAVRRPVTSNPRVCLEIAEALVRLGAAAEARAVTQHFEAGTITPVHHRALLRLPGARQQLDDAMDSINRHESAGDVVTDETFGSIAIGYAVLNLRPAAYAALGRIRNPQALRAQLAQLARRLAASGLGSTADDRAALLELSRRLHGEAAD